LCLLKPSRNHPRQSTQIDAFPTHFAARHAGHMQQIVDEVTHALASGAYALEVVSALGVQLVSKVIQERLAEAVDTLQRSAQVM
jgi:hypothetical protein